jgi:dCTP diphosphatase
MTILIFIKCHPYITSLNNLISIYSIFKNKPDLEHENYVMCSILNREQPQKTMEPTMDALTDLAVRLETFAADREWNQFHSPKNLVMALSVEAAELMEEFLWLMDEQSKIPSAENVLKVKDEIADVFNYLLRLSSKLNIDLIAAAHEKIVKNELKYPVDIARGNAKKYTEL